MKIESFQSGRFINQYQYRSFSPVKVNCAWSWEDATLNSLLSEANRYLGELNAHSQLLLDVDFYIKMHVLKEANASSRIEGTQTNIETAAMPREVVDPEQRDDWQEVQNYVDAMNYAVQGLDQLPLSNRLLRDAHRILMRGVRGKNKTPGEFRLSQNWIGGTGLEDATFIPPHHEEVPELMADLEKFWHNEAISVPHLIRVAISHYQFETVHPFQDGNGRIGRLLITLYLMGHGLLAKPCLYLSDFLERNRPAYYDALMAVRTRNDMLSWVKFILNAFIQTSQEAVLTFRSITELRQSIDQKVVGLGARAENAKKIVDYMYSDPFITSEDVSESLKVAPSTANRLLSTFLELGIIVESTGFQRNRLFRFEPYLALFR